jgi:hypothetical protein
MLLAQSLVWEITADEPLEQRSVQVEAFVAVYAERVRVDFGAKLSEDWSE